VSRLSLFLALRLAAFLLPRAWAIELRCAAVDAARSAMKIATGTHAGWPTPPR